MSLQSFRSDERGVSVVVGVILMVAIAVVLATVASSAILSASDEVEYSNPDMGTVYVEQSGSTVQVDFENPGSNRPVTLMVNDQEVRDILPEAGETYELTGVAQDDVIRGTVKTDSGSEIVFTYTSTSSSPVFSTRIDNVDTPTFAGGTVTVDTTITNTGGEQGEQEIVLKDFDGDVVDTTPAVSLDPGESQSFQLQWNTAIADNGTDTITVASKDTAQSQEITLNEPAPDVFVVDITNTNSPVTGGETLDVTIDLENTGDQSGTQTIKLYDVDDNEVDSSTVSLNAGETTQITLNWGTSSGDAGTDSVKVTSEDQTDTQGVTVHEPAYFAVDILNTNSAIDEGDTLRVDYYVENTGETAATKEVRLYDISGNEQDSRTIQLDPGQSATGQLQWNTNSFDDGSGDVVVESNDDSASRSVTINSTGGGTPGFAFPFVILAMYLSKLFRGVDE